MAMQSVLEGQAAGKPSAVVDSRPIHSEELEMIVGIALEPVRRLLHLMEYGDKGDVNDGPTGHAGAAAGTLLDAAEGQIINAMNVVQDSLGRINVRYQEAGVLSHIREFVGVEFTPRSGVQIVAAPPCGAAKAAADGPARRGDRDELEYLAKTIWEYFEFLHEGFISTRTDSLYPMQARGLKQVLFDVSDLVNSMGRCLGMERGATAPPVPGMHVPELSDYKEQAAEYGELPTAAFALNDAFAFLDQVFISRAGDMDEASLDGLRRVLRSIHGRVDNLLNLAEAAHAEQAGPAGEAKPGRVVPFKAPAAPAEPGLAQEPQAAAGGVRFARDLCPEAEPAPAPRRGLLSWLNPRNWTR